ncbi:hypothetical protein ACWGB8_01625 [Kitasatospora sp. NPDC054939]
MTVTDRIILTGIALTVADITPAAIRTINPGTGRWIDPEVSGLLAQVDETDREIAYRKWDLARYGGAWSEYAQLAAGALKVARLRRAELEDRLLAEFVPPTERRVHPDTLDLIDRIAAGMLAGCPHDAEFDGDGECPECRAQLDEDAAEYRAYAYH